MSLTASASSIGNNNSATAFASVAPVVGRTLIGSLFLLSGVAKLGAATDTIGMIAASGLPFAPLAFAIAVTTEIAGSLALIAGYRVRIVATVMALFTIATAAAFHTNLADQNEFFHFFKNIAIAGGLLQVVAFGAGPLSLDAYRR